MARHSEITFEEALELFSLQAGFTEVELTKAYRREVFKHHPDRFANADPSVLKREAEYTLRLNLARALLETMGSSSGAISPSSQTESETPPTATPNSTYQSSSAYSNSVNSEHPASAEQPSQDERYDFSWNEPTYSDWVFYCESYEEFVRLKKGAEERQATADAAAAAFDWQGVKARVADEVWEAALDSAQYSVFIESFGDPIKSGPMLRIPEVRAAGFIVAYEAYKHYDGSDSHDRELAARKAYEELLPFDRHGGADAVKYASRRERDAIAKQWEKLQRTMDEYIERERAKRERPFWKFWAR